MNPEFWYVRKFGGCVKMNVLMQPLKMSHCQKYADSFFLKGNNSEKSESVAGLTAGSQS